MCYDSITSEIIIIIVIYIHYSTYTRKEGFIKFLNTILFNEIFYSLVKSPQTDGFGFSHSEIRSFRRAQSAIIYNLNNKWSVDKS